MKRMIFLAAVLGVTVFSFPARADLNILSTVPEWAALAQEIGGAKVKVTSATSGKQDPHHIEARPSLVARARNADLVLSTGAELETGWLPVVLRESGNARVQPGQPGNFEAARYVTMLEIPARLDRSEGDVHAAGNPHIQTDPRNFFRVAEALAARMSELDSANNAIYAAGLVIFSERWRAAIARWESQAAPLRGANVVAQHSSFTYMNNWLGLRQIATLEPKPGVEPSVAHLGEVVAQTAGKNVRLVLRAAYNSSRPAEWYSQQSHVPVAVLPFTVGGDDKATNLYTLFDVTIARLLGEK